LKKFNCLFLKALPLEVSLTTTESLALQGGEEVSNRYYCGSYTAFLIPLKEEVFSILTLSTAKAGRFLLLRLLSVSCSQPF